MRYLVLISLVLLVSCKREQAAPQYSTPQKSELLPFQEYIPNPNDAVVRCRLISSTKQENGSYLLDVEVLEQFKVGFATKRILSAGENLWLRSKREPISEVFVCAIVVEDLREQKNGYRIAQFLK